MLAPEDRVSIEAVLRRTVQVTRQRRNEARYELQRAVSEIPSGIPAPDGGVRSMRPPLLRDTPAELTTWP